MAGNQDWWSTVTLTLALVSASQSDLSLKLGAGGPLPSQVQNLKWSLWQCHGSARLGRVRFSFCDSGLPAVMFPIQVPEAQALSHEFPKLLVLTVTPTVK